MSKTKTILLATVCVALSSCANMNSIHREGTIRTAPAGAFGYLAIDAKQRVVLVGANGRICAEQAPDVFSVLSSSLAGAADLGAKEGVGNPSVRLAISMAESGAAIRRSQAVNLLAQSMYRTCERWMSEAIGDAEFRVQTARDHRAMIGVLAIEQLTTLGQQPATVVLGGGRADADASGGDTSALVAAKTKADAASKEAKRLREAATEAVATATDTPKTCAKVEDEADKTTCETAARDATEAEAAAKREEAYYQRLVKDPASTVTAAAEGATGETAKAETSPSLSDSAVWSIAYNVRLIALEAMNFDEDGAACRAILQARTAAASALSKPSDGAGSAAAKEALADTVTELRNLSIDCQRAGAATAAADENRPAAFSNVTRPSQPDPRTPKRGVGLLRGYTVYIHYPTDGQAEAALTARSNIANEFEGVDVPAIELRPSSPAQSEVRYFRDQDAAAAKKLADVLLRMQRFGAVTARDLSGRYRARNALIEVWLGRDAR